MDPSASSGLATRSSDHGCSTVKSADWYVVASNGKHVRMHNGDSFKDSSEATSYLKAALKVGSTDPEMTDSSLKVTKGKNNLSKDTAGPKIFSPPKKNINQTDFTSLNSYQALFGEEESDDTEEDEVNQKNKNISGESKLDFPQPPHKKIKITQKESQSDDDFLQAIEEFKAKPAPEYAFSAQDAATSKKYKTDSDGNQVATNQEHQFIEEIETVNIDCDTADTIDCAQHNLIEESYYKNSFGSINPGIEQTAKDILMHPMANQFDEQVSHHPKLYTLLYPMSNNLLPFYRQDYHGTEDIIDHWWSHGERKRNELKREEKLFIIQDLFKNGMEYSYIEFHDLMEDIYDCWDIPDENRSIFRNEEFKFITLLLHDENASSILHNDSYQEREPSGTLFKYFSRDDTISTARFKWLSAIKQDYIWFWNTLHKDVYPSSLSSDDLVKFSDLYEIIKFINPKAIYQTTEDPIYSQRLLGIINKSIGKHPWITTRHKYFYEWQFFGWKQLPSDYPLHKHPSQTHKEVSNWIHKRISHKEYITRDLFIKTRHTKLININLKQVSADGHNINGITGNNITSSSTLYSFINEFGNREFQDTNNPIYIKINDEEVNKHRWLDDFDKNKYSSNYSDILMSGSGFDCPRDSDPNRISKITALKQDILQKKGLITC